MRRLGISLTFLTVLALVLTTHKTRGQDTPKKDTEKSTPKKEPEKLTPLGQYSGTLVNQDEGKSLTVRIPLRYVEPNPSAIQQQQNLARRQIEIMRNPNPTERQQQLAQLANDVAQNQRNMYTTRETQKDVECQISDTFKVRRLQPLPPFDDRGNPRKYSAQELRELKGEGNLPGYKSDAGDLRIGQNVTVHLAVKKSTVSSTKSKDADKELEKTLLNSDRPYVTMLVIVAEPVDK